jgi:flavin reductase (DIM6/NTAB) family NADH-FMN oxidoreductase RutF
MLLACTGTSGKQAIKEEANASPIDYMNVKDKSFEELFRLVEPDEVKKNLTELMVEEDNTVLTAGSESHYNSMAASWEAMFRYFREPKTFCFLGAKRYTLELIRKHQSYTMSFMPEQYQSEMFAFGAKSGRDSDKMKETKLTAVSTPSGNMTYKEARVVIECRLFEITSTHPDDFYTEDGKNFVENGYNEGNDYHKLVFGTVTNVWVRK